MLTASMAWNHGWKRSLVLAVPRWRPPSIVRIAAQATSGRTHDRDLAVRGASLLA
ncbi:hypothetical protein ACFWNN_09500 [Lentzea sp. NPDC058450]|uniref:hypothetical protein n=1 Tax=Lentzea sp. NPDC058450 TaxID=3346505 RepID=UPI003667FD94